MVAPSYFSPPPAELAEPFALLLGLFLPPIELALLVPPALLLIIFDDDLRGFASATLAVNPAAIVATASTERNFFTLNLLWSVAIEPTDPGSFLHLPWIKTQTTTLHVPV